MPANENYADLDFPLSGLSLIAEFQEQPPGTTASSQNVRSLNPDTLRMRGGSRAGLARYINGRIPADTSESMLIQHLAVIVDPQAAALGQNFEVPGDDWTEDPLNPGFFVPPGGWGWPGGSPQRSNAAYVQGKRQKFDVDSIEQSVAFPASVTFNNTLVVFVATGADGLSGVTVTVKNNSSTTGWIQVGGYVEVINPVGGAGSTMRLSCWKKTANSGSDDNTVKVQPGNAAMLAVVVLEYSGMPTSGQADSTNTNSDASLSPAAPATTGNVAVLGDREVLLGAFATNFDASAFTAGTGFTCRPSADNGVDSGDVPEFRLNVVEKTGLNHATNDPTAATGTTTGGEDPYVAIGATFKST